MAKYTAEEFDIFFDHNEDCNVSGLLEWIADLLPQQQFDDHVADIKEMNKEREED